MSGRKKDPLSSLGIQVRKILLVYKWYNLRLPISAELEEKN
nr:hypothetical protein [Desulfopila inferna]